MQKIQQRNKIILILVALFIASWAYMFFYHMPKQAAAEKAHEEAMLTATGHDFKEVLQYKSKYMGDASNLSNLFYRLPLSNVRHTYELEPENLKANIIYETTYADISRKEQRANLIYSATAGFTLIDNLEIISFKFKDVTFTIHRESVEKYYKQDQLSTLQDKEKWKTTIQEPLNDKQTMEKLFKEFFIAE